MTDTTRVFRKASEKRGLTVVDMQNTFGPGGTLEVQGIPQEVPREVQIANIVELWHKHFERRAATRDAHPKEGHIEFDIFGPHAVDGTEDAEYPKRIRYMWEHADDRLEKGRDPAIIAYSAETSPNWAPHIAALRQDGITQVYVVGDAYTHCVGATALAYANQGFKTFVVRDATRSVPAPYGDPENMRQRLELAGVHEVSLSEVL